MDNYNLDKGLEKFNENSIKLVFSNKPEYATTILGLIFDVCQAKVEKYYMLKDVGELDLEMPLELSKSKEFVQGLDEISKELSNIVKAFVRNGESPEHSISIFRNIISIIADFLDSAVNGNAFDVSYIKSHIANIDFHKEFENMINENILDEEKDKSFAMVNKIDHEKFLNMEELLRDDIMSFKEKGFSLICLPVVNDEIIKKEEYLDRHKEDEELIDGVYMCISKDGKVFNSSWIKELRDVGKFINLNKKLLEKY